MGSWNLCLRMQIALDGEAWKKRPQQSTPGLMRQRNKDHEIPSKHVDILLEKLGSAGRDASHSKSADIQTLLRLHSLQISMAILGVINDSTDAHKLSAVFDAAFDLSTAYVYKRVALGSFYWLADPFAFRRACRQCQTIVDNAARPVWTAQQEARCAKRTGLDKSETQSSSSSYASTLLEELVRSQDAYPQLASVVLNLIIASYETTDALLSWTFYFLARHPESYRILRLAILNDFGTPAHPRQSLNVQTLLSCTYLQYCMKESLRLEPPVPRSGKTAVRDTVLPSGGGSDGTQPVFVPKVCSSV